MSVLTPKRVVLWVVAAVLLATNALANHPSPRNLARMVWDTRENVGVLFGGRAPSDSATGITHASSETWLWTGRSWAQRFPATVPPARSAHSMTYDSRNGRVLMFGGRVEPVDRDSEPTYLSDLWAWKDGNWTRLDADADERPSPRHYSAMAYDLEQNRLVLYGGIEVDADGFTLKGDYDTWEYDGAQWTRIHADAPQVSKPSLLYDIAHKRMLMMGVSDAGDQRLMYSYDTATHTWTQLTPAAMPTCVNEGHLVYQLHNDRPLFFGGVCQTDTPSYEEVFEFDGSTWNKLQGTTLTRGLGQAVAYDDLREEVVMYGGTTVFGTAPTSFTSILKGPKFAGSVFNFNRPSPRSLTATASDAAHNSVWMYGGLDELGDSYNVDLWGYRGGQWFRNTANTNAPVACETPMSAFDSDRGKLVVLCSGSVTYEWDGAAWKTFSSLKPVPDLRFFAQMVYDQKLKKTVVFGGYYNGNYRNDTWVWDGTKWEELDDIRNSDRPPHRGLYAMWYDPLLQKTVLYGGFGRPSVNEKITRYEDMWAFDGSKWAKLSPSTTPGPRFGPQVAVNGVTGKVLLFGGLRSEQVAENSIRQYFDNDTWEWNGADSKWTKLEPATVPPVRENGAMAWDPSANEFVLFGGYANGFYLSDTWTWDGIDWRPRIDLGTRRRSTR